MLTVKEIIRQSLRDFNRINNFKKKWHGYAIHLVCPLIILLLPWTRGRGQMADFVGDYSIYAEWLPSNWDEESLFLVFFVLSFFLFVMVATSIIMPIAIITGRISAGYEDRFTSDEEKTQTINDIIRKYKVLMIKVSAVLLATSILSFGLALLVFMTPVPTEYATIAGILFATAAAACFLYPTVFLQPTVSCRICDIYMSERAELEKTAAGEETSQS